MIHTIKLLNVALCLTVLTMITAGCSGRGSQKDLTSTDSRSEARIKIIDLPDEKRVDVLIDNNLFTSYIYPDQIKKPVLYPIKTSSGKILSRGFPLEAVPGERVDHPHHVGHWMNFGDVNGLDFWNNSTARSEEDSHLYGTIYHKEVRSIQESDDSGVLAVVCEWKTPEGEILLEEHTRFVFSAPGDSRIVDRITTLKALSQEVSFKDNKEGMFAVRVARALELPSDKPDIFTDAHGNPTETKVLDNTGVNGNYLSSEGVEGGAAWGTRARWMELFSTMKDEHVALVIFDHPDNVGYPTYWHARGYGLFAANPLGQAVFSKGERVLDFRLAPYESVTFKFRLLVHSGESLRVESIDKMADDFAKMQTPQEMSSMRWKEVVYDLADEWYGSEEAIRIAENVLLYQRDIGGWPKNKPMHHILSEKEDRKLQKLQSNNKDATIDNGATVMEITYLSRVYKATKNEKYRAACLKGVDYLIEAQYPNGGWPQFFPLKNNYSRHITYNDGSMVNVLKVMHGIAQKNDVLSIEFDDQTVMKAKQAFEKGIHIILESQFRQDGAFTVWCAQHDEVTLEPAMARSYELPSLSGSESAGIVLLLMSIEDPSPEVVMAVQSAVRWFEKTRIKGIRVESYRRDDGVRERRVVVDENAPALWARFYELSDNRPFFCDRDGIKKYSMAEIGHERRINYGWYSTAPQKVLDAYGEWQSKFIIEN